MGMSCVGKTTFANLLQEHVYYCFDALFHWHLIETLGFSTKANLEHIRDRCLTEKFVLDGWHLSDKDCNYLPYGAKVYVIFAPYDQVVKQYRIPVTDHEEYRVMFEKWYFQIDYARLAARFFLNTGDFLEITRDQFYRFTARKPLLS